MSADNLGAKSAHHGWKCSKVEAWYWIKIINKQVYEIDNIDKIMARYEITRFEGQVTSFHIIHEGYSGQHLANKCFRSCVALYSNQNHYGVHRR